MNAPNPANGCSSLPEDVVMVASEESVATQEEDSAPLPRL